MGYTETIEDSGVSRFRGTHTHNSYVVHGCDWDPDEDPNPLNRRIKLCTPGPGEHVHWEACHADHPVCAQGVGRDETGSVWTHVGFNQNRVPSVYEAHGHEQLGGCDDEDSVTLAALNLSAQCVQTPPTAARSANHPNMAVVLSWDEPPGLEDFTHYKIAISDRSEVVEIGAQTKRPGTDRVVHRVDMSGGRTGWSAPLGQRVGFKVWAFADAPDTADATSTRSQRLAAWDTSADAHSGWAHTTCPVLPPTDLSVECVTVLRAFARDTSEFRLSWVPAPGVNHDKSSPDTGYVYDYDLGGGPAEYRTGKYRYEIQARNDDNEGTQDIPITRVEATSTNGGRTWVLPASHSIDRPGSVGAMTKYSFRIKTVYMPRGSHYTESQLPSPEATSEWSRWVPIVCNEPARGEVELLCAADSRSVTLFPSLFNVPSSDIAEVFTGSRPSAEFVASKPAGAPNTYRDRTSYVWLVSATVEGSPGDSFTEDSLTRRPRNGDSVAVLPGQKVTVTYTAYVAHYYADWTWRGYSNFQWVPDRTLGTLATITAEKTCPVPPPLGVRAECSSNGEAVTVRWNPTYPVHRWYDTVPGRLSVNITRNALADASATYSPSSHTNHEYRYEIETRNNAFPKMKVHYAPGASVNLLGVSPEGQARVRIEGSLLFYRSYTSVPGETYGFRVRTIHVPTGTPTATDGAVSQWSQWYMVACPRGPLQAPSNVGVECAATGTSLTISWDAVTGAMWSGWRSGQCGQGPQIVTGVSGQCSDDGTSLTVSWNRAAKKRTNRASPRPPSASPKP